jgi:hypothetical protein
MKKQKYEVIDCLSEIEDALSELERTAEDLINCNATAESTARGQGIHTATAHLRFRIRGIRRGENI